jgi:hypothetical protein
VTDVPGVPEITGAESATELWGAVTSIENAGISTVVLPSLTAIAMLYYADRDQHAGQEDDGYADEDSDADEDASSQDDGRFREI